jgi:hypothetical protein
MFSLHWFPFHPGIWKYNQDQTPATRLEKCLCGPLLWEGAALGNSEPFSTFVWSWDPLITTLHKPSSNVNLYGFLLILLHDREMLPDGFHQRLRRSSTWCQSPAAQQTTCGLLAGDLKWFSSGEFQAYCWKFTFIEILFHDFGSFSVHRVQPTHFSSTRTNWSTYVYCYLPLSTTAYHWLKQ